MPDATSTQIQVRRLQPEDLGEIVTLDELLTGEAKPRYWEDVVERFLCEEGCIGLAATDGHSLKGYLFGELRAFEFGSDACGWIFAVGVQRDAARTGVASALLDEACWQFRELGVDAVRTMVPRTDVPFLSFFRSNGFVGGPFVQLELSLDPNEQEGQP